MKILTPTQVKTLPENPWGNAPFYSTEHARWLANKILRDVNKNLRAGVTIFQSKSNLFEWPECRIMIREDLEKAGWLVKFIFEDHRMTIKLTEKLLDK